MSSDTLKLASPSFLRQVTGKKELKDQYQVLIELGCRPIFQDGKIRIYHEAIIRAMVVGNKVTKPELKI